MGMLVPYDPSAPLGSSPEGPAKRTYCADGVGAVTPAACSSRHSGTPVHSELPSPAGPHEKLER